MPPSVSSRFVKARTPSPSRVWVSAGIFVWILTLDLVHQLGTPAKVVWLVVQNVHILVTRVRVNVWSRVRADRL